MPVNSLDKLSALSTINKPLTFFFLISFELELWSNISYVFFETDGRASELMGHADCSGCLSTSVWMTTVPAVVD